MAKLLRFVCCSHPDKTRDPEAQVKFVEMKQAYELLSDPDRRRR